MFNQLLSFRVLHCLLPGGFSAYNFGKLTVILSMYEDVPHGFNVLVSIIWRMRCLVSTRVGVILCTSCAKTNARVTSPAFILLISGDADSCFGITRVVSYHTKSFHIAVGLQGGLWANQELPRVTT